MITAAQLLAEAAALGFADGEVVRDEIRLRTAAGRAYYAVFHHMRKICGTLGYSYDRNVEPKGYHEQLYCWANLHSHPDIRAAAALARQLRAIRTDADYSLGHAFGPASFVGAYTKARHIIAKIVPAEKFAPAASDAANSGGSIA